MTTATRLWTCTACAREYAAEPLRCECGSREFTAVSVAPSAFRLHVEAHRHELADMVRKHFLGKR